MDNRILILGGALLFVVVALGLLVASLSRAARVRRAASMEDEQSAWHADAKPPTQEVDTSLEGLELKVAPESPSAALLQPLRMGDWQPPAEPAPVAHLAPASLEHRLKGFGGAEQAPATSVEPASVPKPADVSATAPATSPAPKMPAVEPPTRTEPPAAPVPPAPAKAAPPANDHAERLANLPDVLPAPGGGAPSVVPQDAPVPAWKPLELLLPEVVIPATTVPSTEPMQVSVASEESAPESPVAARTAPVPTPAVAASVVPTIKLPEPEPADAASSASAQGSLPTPSRSLGSTPESSWLHEIPVVAAVAPALTAEPVFPEAFEWQPPQVPAPQPDPVPAPQPAPEPSAQPAPEPSAQPAPVTAPVAPEPVPPVMPEPSRPAPQPPAPAPVDPIVSPSPKPAVPVPEPSPTPAVPVPEPAQAPVAEPTPSAQAAPTRPRAHAHAIPSAAVAHGGGSDDARAAETALPQLPTGEELVMAAPVEMWFGDYRVGVKLGTKTHAQFRKYADVLLGDLKGTGGRIR